MGTEILRVGVGSVGTHARPVGQTEAGPRKDFGQTMSEWQPAKTCNAHSRGASKGFVQLRDKNTSSKEIIRIKPWDFKESQVALYRSIGCDAKKFFLIHPEDAAKI